MNDVNHEHQGRLLAAARRHELVRVRRCLAGADVLDGHVVAIGRRWAALSVLEDTSPNGWVVLDVRDIEAVESAPGAPFARRTLEAHRQWPPGPPEVVLDLDADAFAVIRAAASAFELITLYTERDDPTSCLIGRPGGWAGEVLRWRHIGLDASWHPELVTVAASDVTRIDIGGRYEQALLRLSSLRGL